MVLGNGRWKQVGHYRAVHNQTSQVMPRHGVRHAFNGVERGARAASGSAPSPRRVGLSSHAWSTPGKGINVVELAIGYSTLRNSTAWIRGTSRVGNSFHGGGTAVTSLPGTASMDVRATDEAEADRCIGR